MGQGTDDYVLTMVTVPPESGTLPKCNHLPKTIGQDQSSRGFGGSNCPSIYL